VKTGPGVTRRQNPRGQGGRLRAEIVDAAFEVLDTEAISDGVTLRAAARAAGVTAPALYAHFANVDELRAAMRDSAFESMVHLADEAAAAAADPAGELLLRARSVVDFAVAHPARYRLMFTPIPGSSTEVGERTFAALVDVLDRCVAARLSASQDAVTDAAHVLAALQGLAVTRTTMTEFHWPALDVAVRDIVTRVARLIPPPMV